MNTKSQSQEAASEQIPLVEVAKCMPCLICGKPPEHFAVLVAKRGSALVPADGTIRRRRIPYSLCEECTAIPDVVSDWVEPWMLYVLERSDTVLIRVDDVNNVPDTVRGGEDAS